MRILLVEDDRMLASAVKAALRQSAHAVQVSASGLDADHALSTNEYDLVLLDIGLPEIDGLEVLRRLRARRNTVPVLLLTVRDSDEDVVTGLDLGADDYLAKPFRLSELEARVRALIRRAHLGIGSSISHGRLYFDVAGRRLYADGKPLELTTRELAVMELLLLREGKVVTKQRIADHLFGLEDVSSGNAVDVFVHRLRRKLEGCGVDIRTVRGMGYLVEKPDAA